MSDSLKISVIVDGSQVSAGMNNVTTSVDAATARIKAAFGSVEKAPEGIRNALMILQNQAKMSGESVAIATAAIAGLGGASASAAPQVASVGAAASSTAAQMTGMDRAMAMADGRVLGMLGGFGMLGGALGRVGAASSTLGPILAAAFPVILAVAFVDILGKAWEGLRKLSLEAFNNAIAWEKIDHESNAALEQIDRSIERIGAKVVELTQGKMAALRLEMRQIGDGSVEMAGKMLTLFDGIGNQLEKEIPLFDKVKEFALFMGNSGSFILPPNIGEKAKGFGADLAKTLDNNGLAAGIEKVSNQIRIVNQELAATPGDKQLQEYADQLIRVLGLLEARQTLENKQKDEKGAEIQKEKNTELEKSEQINERLIADTKRMAEADLKELEAKKRLQEQAEKDLNKNDSFDQDVRDMRLRDDADEASTNARLQREKEASVTSIEVEQDRVKELARLGQIGSKDEVQRLNDLEAQKLQIEKAYIQQRIDTILARMGEDNAEEYKRDKAEWDRLLNEKQKAEDTYLKNREKNINAAATNEEKVWDRLGQGISREMDRAVQGIVSGTERFGTAFARMIDDMLARFIQAMLQMVEQWIVSHVLMIAVKKAAHQQEVLMDAKAAAAAAWKAVAQIPIVGPVLAPIAAAVAFAGVEAFSAEGGMDFVPADNTLALLHQREMVLPANIADSIRGITNGASQGGAGASGAGGGDVHIHYSPNIQAVDAQGVQDVLTKHSAHLAKLMRKELRRSNAI